MGCMLETQYMAGLVMEQIDKFAIRNLIGFEDLMLSRDAMSAVSNWHTMTGSENFVYKQ